MGPAGCCRPTTGQLPCAAAWQLDTRRHAPSTRTAGGNTPQQAVSELLFSSTPTAAQIDVKLSVRGNPRGRGTEAHHQRDQTVEVTVYTLRWALCY